MQFKPWLASLLVVAGFSGATVWFLVPGEAARLREKNEQLARQTFELQQAILRLSGEERVAEVHVTDQVLAGELVNGRPAEADSTTLEFIELDRKGHPLPGRRFVVADRVIHFDALVVKFDHQRVAHGDLLKGKSLLLFRRVYGDSQSPADGFAVDPAGDAPNVDRVNPQPSDFERKLWSTFWDYATNPERAAAEGVRTVQGETVYVPMRKGDVWTLSLQNNGGLNILLHRSALDGPSREHAEPPAGSQG